MVLRKYTKLWTERDNIARRNVECDSRCSDLLTGLFLPVLSLSREELGGDMGNDTTL